MNSNGSGQDTVRNWEGGGSGHRCSELRMDVDEESGGGAVQGDSESEREEFDNEGSEFDEAAEADLQEDLSDSDMLSELDLMLESDDLAADQQEAEEWDNREYLLRDSNILAIKRFLIRKENLN